MALARAAEASYETETWLDLMVDSLRLCETADIWLDSAAANPGAVGKGPGERVTFDDLQFVCEDVMFLMAVCADGVADGVINER